MNEDIKIYNKKNLFPMALINKTSKTVILQNDNSKIDQSRLKKIENPIKRDVEIIQEKKQNKYQLIKLYIYLFLLKISGFIVICSICWTPIIIMNKFLYPEVVLFVVRKKCIIINLN